MKNYIEREREERNLVSHKREGKKPVRFKNNNNNLAKLHGLNRSRLGTVAFIQFD